MMMMPLAPSMAYASNLWSGESIAPSVNEKADYSADHPMDRGWQPWFENSSDRFVNPAVTSLSTDSLGMYQSAGHFVDSSGMKLADDVVPAVVYPVKKEEEEEAEGKVQPAGTFMNETPVPPVYPSNQPPSPALRKSSSGVGAARKRKQRESMNSLWPQPKTLQIVQEDGQGGSFAPADFVGPPRGARRKGPLSTTTRANAGMRRKNKDTCVQCRLNKRKVWWPLSP